MKEIDIVKKLQNNGFEAYFVGGCVRDMILKKPPKDVDIVTSATPEEVSKIFETSFFVGESFGISLVNGVEVATFRSESSYDGRRPGNISFGSSLEEDSNRRDFTFNALYFDPIKDNIIDLHNGIEDLKNGIVRFIGNAEDRIKEDHLRILRAIRFSVTYGFNLDKDTIEAIKKWSSLVRIVSSERIVAEIKKTGNKFSEFIKKSDELLVLDKMLGNIALLKEVPQDSRWHPEGDAWTHTLKVLDNLHTDDFVLNMAGLFHDFGKLTTTVVGDCKISSHGHEEESLRLTEPILLGLKLSNKEIVDILWLIEFHMRIKHFRIMKKSKKIELAKDERIDKLTELSIADSMIEGNLSEALLVKEEILKLKEDKRTFASPVVNGMDLISIGLKPGPNFKEILDYLFEVQINEGITEKSVLLEMIPDHLV